MGIEAHHIAGLPEETPSSKFPFRTQMKRPRPTNKCVQTPFFVERIDFMPRGNALSALVKVAQNVLT